MGFAFDHIDCAKDICHMLRRALMAEAPVAAKVGRDKTIHMKLYMINSLSLHTIYTHHEHVLLHILSHG